MMELLITLLHDAFSQQFPPWDLLWCLMFLNDFFPIAP